MSRLSGDNCMCRWVTAVVLSLTVVAFPVCSFADEVDPNSGADEVSVSVEVGNHGAVNERSEDYTEKVSSDEPYELKITSEEGYVIHSLLVNDEPVSESIAAEITGKENAEIKLEDVGGDVDVSAVFRAKATDTDELKEGTDAPVDETSETTTGAKNGSATVSVTGNNSEVQTAGAQSTDNSSEGAKASDGDSADAQASGSGTEKEQASGSTDSAKTSDGDSASAKASGSGTEKEQASGSTDIAKASDGDSANITAAAETTAKETPSETGTDDADLKAGSEGKNTGSGTGSPKTGDDAFRLFVSMLLAGMSIGITGLIVELGRRRRA